MPIFKKKDTRIQLGGGSTDKSDKMKDIVKKLNEGKVILIYISLCIKFSFHIQANIKDVFFAVDNEGDSSGTISIDEF